MKAFCRAIARTIAVEPDEVHVKQWLLAIAIPIESGPISVPHNLNHTMIVSVE